MTTTPSRRQETAPAEVDPRAERFVALGTAREDVSLARLRSSYGLFINGEFVDALDGSTFATTNPATGENLAAVAHAGAADVDAAIGAARAAQPAWAALSGIERGKYMFRLARRVAERARSFAVLETLDGGKPIRESRDIDIPLAAQHLFHHAGWADKLSTANLGPNPRPLGVAGQIIPWNFPLLMASWKIGPALACGNTVVLKPAETTPLTALALAECAAEIGLPPGVLNVLAGDGATGAALGAHPGLDKLAFTGSTEVGRQLAHQLAGTGRRLTLELGGKSANIVFADAALDAVVEGIVQAIFFNQGHVCCAGSRLLVAEPILDELTARLAHRVAQIRVGDPLDKNTELGAINSPAQLARITALVDDAVASGVQRITSPAPLPTTGCFYSPTVLVGVDPASRISREEIFGPVLTVSSFRTPEEAVALANDSRYGLAAGVWSQHPERSHWVAERLKAGVVWINTYNNFDPTAAFGGFKESGYGREGGRAGLEAYCA
jgi:aldehyde dehydrogenase (NAD+)